MNTIRVYDFSVPCAPASLLARILATSLTEPPAEQEATMTVCQALGQGLSKAAARDPEAPVQVGPGVN